MKYLTIKMLTIAALFSVAAVNANTATGPISVYMPVSMTGTAASNLGWSGSIYQHDSDELRACFKVQLEYGMNNKRDALGAYFTPTATNVFRVGPTDTNGTTNTTTDWAGINLLFSDAFDSGDITFSPKAQDLVVDFGMYVDLSEWLDGLFFRSHLPLQNSRWEIEITEGTIRTASAAFDAGDVANDGTTTYVTPYANVTAALKGDKTVGNSAKWSYGRIDGKQTETRIGDANLTLGYNFVNKEHCHLGLGVTGILGGGKKTTAEYVFQPVIGYAGRYGVGGTVDGGCRLWDKDEDHQLVANVNFYAAHLFANEQRRNYDITDCGDFSRYLLVKKFTSNAAVNAAGNLENMINVGALRAKIGIDVVYNGNLTFSWQMGNVSVDFGYQVAGHGKEKHKEWVDTITADTYVLYELQNADLNTGGADDLAQPKVNISGDDLGSTAIAVTAGSANYIINDDLNKDSGLMKSAVEHTVFAGVNYNWSDNEWNPGVGMLGSYHISGSNNNTFDRWSVGFQFNFSV